MQYLLFRDDAHLLNTGIDNVMLLILRAPHACESNDARTPRKNKNNQKKIIWIISHKLERLKKRKVFHQIYPHFNLLGVIFPSSCNIYICWGDEQLLNTGKNSTINHADQAVCKNSEEKYLDFLQIRAEGSLASRKSR